MRTPFIAGNWKMNKTISEAVLLLKELADRVKNVPTVEIGVCTPAIDLAAVKEIAMESGIKVGAQNMHWEDAGAYTGEISGPMLAELDIDYVILGHSERRQYFAETDWDINRKVKAAFKNGLKPIICVGETLAERKKKETESKVKIQVEAALSGISASNVEKAVIAYEPIWAIGTGESATPEEANRVIAYIRQIIAENYGDSADKVRIQYGGSVKPHNVKEIMQQEEIDGVLVGGASLTAESFTRLIFSTQQIYAE